MNEDQYTFYRHSGRFGAHGPLLSILAALVVAYPLGIAYSYLIRWIPFIYLNFLITVGYGLAFGLITVPILRFAKVRNTLVALLTGLAVGLIAAYFNWNGFAHTLVKEPPAVIAPGQLFRFMGAVYEHGSWGLGFRSDTPVTGFLLALVWLGEAVIIIGGATLLAFSAVSEVPFCERCGSWLNEEQKIDKLDAFTQPDQVAALKAGSLTPLEAARPRIPASGAFARLTLRHSPPCEDFCTLSVENVTVTYDKDGKTEEKIETLMTNLAVPKSMLEYLKQFEHASARPAPGAS